MQRFVLLAMAVLIAGCAAPPPKEEFVTPAPTPKVKIENLDLQRNSKVALLNDKGEALKVGDEFDDARKLFPKGNGAGFTDLHPALDSAKFDAWGWEGKNGKSFGVIMEDIGKQVAVAMRTYKDQGQAEVDALIKQYEELLDKKAETVPATPPGKSATYYFWEDNLQRLMICAVTNTKGGYNVVVAAGDSQVMDAISASKKGAEVGIKAGDDHLQKKQ
jgi:hypothetical protein